MEVAKGKHLFMSKAIFAFGDKPHPMDLRMLREVLYLTQVEVKTSKFILVFQFLK